VHDKSLVYIPTVCNNWLRIKLVSNQGNRGSICRQLSIKASQ